jgi:hypothetical protein
MSVIHRCGTIIREKKTDGQFRKIRTDARIYRKSAGPNKLPLTNWIEAMFDAAAA